MVVIHMFRVTISCNMNKGIKLWTWKEVAIWIRQGKVEYNLQKVKWKFYYGKRQNPYIRLVKLS
jgi:hypothetical protein